MRCLMPLAAFFFALGCGGEAVVKPEVQAVAPVERTVPDWSEADMAIWHFAKARGVHGNDISRRAVDDYGFFRVRDKSAKASPIHAGPPKTPSIWVVRSGDTLFELEDAAMGPVLMTKNAEALVKVYIKTLSWMGADDAHAIQQSQTDGVTTLTWVHDRKEYPPMEAANWERITVTATKEGTRVDRQSLKDYVRPQ